MTRGSLSRRVTSARIARAAARGFTLVELMVSLIAGLIIALACMGLAKTATATFHEQARLSVVEGTVRFAGERLRQDLLRAGFMSTGNIRLASSENPAVPFGQKIAVVPGTAGGTASRYGALNDLAGIRIRVGGSRDASFVTTAGTEGPNSLATNNGLNPDALVVSGNLTSDDSYQGILRSDAPLCGGQRIEMKRDGDAAVRRLFDSANPAAALRGVFTPIVGTNYAARVVDARGCQHYVLVCGVEVVSADRMNVHLRPGTGGDVLPPGTGACGASVGEEVTVSPVHRMLWYIGPNTDAALATDPNVEPNGSKFNIYRQLMDASDPPAAVAGAREIVGEYAIDMKFGITVDDPSTPPPNNFRVFDLDSDTGGGNIDSWARAASGSATGAPGPQRIRSVRYRIAARAALPDRAANLVVPPGAPYLSRYCIDTTPVATCKRFARVRTLTSEVTLMNQRGMQY